MLFRSICVVKKEKKSASCRRDFSGTDREKTGYRNCKKVGKGVSYTYDELPGSEREYDRKTALETLKFIVKVGYRIDKED